MKTLTLIAIATIVASFSNASGQNATSSDKQVQGFKSDSPINGPDFTLWLNAVKTANLLDLFQGTGPFTGFIPSNAAIQKYGTEKWNNLLKPEHHDELVSLITYHIVPGAYRSHLMKSEDVRTINGKEIKIRVQNGKITVNGANVVHTDLEGPNGVLQEIDTVLVP